MYPPVVSVAGFANVDRGMFKAVSNLVQVLGCSKKQVPSILHHNSDKIKLQISGGGLVPVRLDRLVYCTGTFAHISIRVILLMDGQKLGVLETAEFYTKSANVRNEALYLYLCPRYILHRATFYNKNNNEN